MSIYTQAFWKDLGERVVSTFGQVGFAFVAAAVAAGQGLLDFDWQTAISVIGASVLLAIFKGLAAGRLNPETGASFGAAVPKADVAAVETENAGQYEAGEAAPQPEGTPVDVVTDTDAGLHDEIGLDNVHPSYRQDDRF